MALFMTRKKREQIGDQIDDLLMPSVSSQMQARRGAAGRKRRTCAA